MFPHSADEILSQKDLSRTRPHQRVVNDMSMVIGLTAVSSAAPEELEGGGSAEAFLLRRDFGRLRRYEGLGFVVAKEVV